MKLNHFLLGLALVAALASCGKKDFKMSNYEYKQSFALKEGRTDSLEVSIRVEYPVSGPSKDAVKAFCETVVEAAFGTSYSGLSVDSAAAVYVDTLLENYRTSNLDMLDYFKNEDFEMPMVWEERLDARVISSHENIISYEVGTYSYEGGAHGSTGENVVNINKKTGEPVEEAEFFVDGYHDELSRLLTAHLHDAVPSEEDYESLFIKDIEPNGNFFVSDEGVTYIYGQYEIGAYALGIIKVTVPWNELSSLVRQQ